LTVEEVAVDFNNDGVESAKDFASLDMGTKRRFANMVKPAPNNALRAAFDMSSTP